MTPWGGCLAVSLAAWLGPSADDCVDAWLGRGWLMPLEPPLYADGTPVLFADPAIQSFVEHCRAVMQNPATREAASARSGGPEVCWVGPNVVAIGDETEMDPE